MNIIIKGRKNLKIDENLKSYINDKLLKYEGLIMEPAVCEVMLADIRGPKRGEDKVVHINMTLPKVKRPLFVRSKSTDFMASIDIAQEKLEQQLKKYKDKNKVGSYFPVKYWLNRMYEYGATGPRWVAKSLKRKRK